MITTAGKNLIAKYLLNQAPEFASHIAVGIGGNAITTSSSVTFLEDASSLNFEVARVPVLSKGLVKEYDEDTESYIEKIVFKAQLPTDQRFQITEIGLYPAESNALAERYNSKILSTFTNSETWSYGNSESTLVVQPLQDNLVDVLGNVALVSSSADPQFYFMNSDSEAFEFLQRKQRNEQPRYLNRAIITYGNSASIDSSFNVSEDSYYVENNSVNINMGNNLPTDKIKLAFSILGRSVSETSPPSVRFVLQFFNNVPGTPSASVSMSINSLDPEDGWYRVIDKSISDFATSPNFSWSNVNKVRIYSSIVDASPEDYFIVLDGLRLENVSTINPLYGLTAAEYMKTQDAFPVLKRENSISYIEYRFGLGVIS